MAINLAQLKTTYPGYAGWNDEASAVADYLATGGAGKGNTPYALGTSQPTTSAGATMAGATSTVPLTFEGLMNQITTSSTGYPEAIKAQEARLPLIQQRYKALLDEIDLAEKEGVTATRQAETAQIGETQARAAAQGIFPGTVELGAEENTRQSALQTILGLGSQATIAKAKALADQATEEGDVSAAIAKLNIDKSTTETARYSKALEFLLDKMQITKAGAGETEKAAALSSMKADVAAGLTIQDLITTYAPKGIDFDEIINAYNSGSRYGAAKESREKLLTMYNKASLGGADYLELQAQQRGIDQQNRDNISKDEDYIKGRMSDDDIRDSLIMNDSDPNDPMFADLYNKNPYKKPNLGASFIGGDRYEVRPWVKPTLEKAGKSYMNFSDFLTKYTNPFVRPKE